MVCKFVADLHKKANVTTDSLSLDLRSSAEICGEKAHVAKPGWRFLAQASAAAMRLEIGG